MPADSLVEPAWKASRALYSSTTGDKAQHGGLVPFTSKSVSVHRGMAEAFMSFLVAGTGRGHGEVQ